MKEIGSFCCRTGNECINASRITGLCLRMSPSDQRKKITTGYCAVATDKDGRKGIMTKAGFKAFETALFLDQDEPEPSPNKI